MKYSLEVLQMAYLPVTLMDVDENLDICPTCWRNNCDCGEVDIIEMLKKLPDGIKETA